MRRESGLSQRALAAQAGTSGPTVAAYESGEKEPRLSTLERLAAAAGYRIDVRLVGADEGSRLRARRERRSLAVAAAAAAAVERDFALARSAALANMARMQEVVGSNPSQELLDEWRRALENGPAEVRTILLDRSDHGHDMRQMTPFAGLLSDDERLAALAVADAYEASIA
jgi:transcriptional regulator with XRE-family HTH domain